MKKTLKSMLFGTLALSIAPIPSRAELPTDFWASALSVPTPCVCTCWNNDHSGSSDVYITVMGGSCAALAKSSCKPYNGVDGTLGNCHACTGPGCDGE